MPYKVAVDHKAVSKSLKAVDPALQKQYAKQLRVQVQAIVQEARAAASWSTQIPPAISASVTATRVAIRVSRKKSTLAVLAEFGPWRHPLFGNTDYWYAQKAKPSVRPAVAANRNNIRRAAAVAAHDAIREAGLNGV